jgi:hypothetical protein
MGPEEHGRCAGRGDRGLGFADRPDGLGAVEQENELVAEETGLASAGGGEAATRLTHPLLVGSDDAERREVGVGELGRRVQEAAATAARKGQSLIERVEEGKELVGRRAAIPRDRLLESDPIPAALLFRVGRDEVVLGANVPVEGHFRHARASDDGVDPDVVNPSRGKEIGRCRQNSGSCRGVRWPHRAFLSHQCSPFG